MAKMQSGLPKSANASSGIECPSRNLKVRRTGREHDWMGRQGRGGREEKERRGEGAGVEMIREEAMAREEAREVGSGRVGWDEAGCGMGMRCGGEVQAGAEVARGLWTGSDGGRVLVFVTVVIVVLLSH